MEKYPRRAATRPDGHDGARSSEARFAAGLLCGAGATGYIVFVLGRPHDPCGPAERRADKTAQSERRFSRGGLIRNAMRGTIRSFRRKDAERLANGYRVRRFVGFERVAQRKLAQPDAAATLDFLQVPPGNRLEALQGDRRGPYGTRDRLCFRFADGDACDAEIYH